MQQQLQPQQMQQFQQMMQAQMAQQMQQHQQMQAHMAQMQQVPPQQMNFQDPEGYERKRPRLGGAPPVGGGVPGQPPVRNNEIGDPSKVVHLRNVTPEVSQLSIQTLAASFGRVRNVVMLRQRNQCLLEMDDLNSAQAMVDFFKDAGFAEIDGRRVYMRYSRHRELTNSVQTCKTLLVSMFNTQYDVSAAATITPMIVYQIFGNYGPVEKIVVLPKNDSSASHHNRVQALVQFDTKENAENVKNMLQGQPVTLADTVTFTLDIQYSRIEELKTSSPHNSLIIPRNSMGQPQPPIPGSPAPQNMMAPNMLAPPGFMPPGLVPGMLGMMGMHPMQQLPPGMHGQQW